MQFSASTIKNVLEAPLLMYSPASVHTPNIGVLTNSLCCLSQCSLLPLSSKWEPKCIPSMSHGSHHPITLRSPAISFPGGNWMEKRCPMRRSLWSVRGFNRSNWGRELNTMRSQALVRIYIHINYTLKHKYTWNCISNRHFYTAAYMMPNAGTVFVDVLSGLSVTVSSYKTIWERTEDQPGLIVKITGLAWMQSMWNVLQYEHVIVLFVWLFQLLIGCMRWRFGRLTNRLRVIPLSGKAEQRSSHEVRVVVMRSNHI